MSALDDRGASQHHALLGFVIAIADVLVYFLCELSHKFRVSQLSSFNRRTILAAA